jgi:hypothetical protein
MNGKTKIFSVIAVALVAAFLIVNSVTSALASSARYKSGYRDGRDHPFSQEKFSKYRDSYLRGFMDGCMSVPANTRASCSGATDAG